MKNMKKLICMLLALTMVLALCACGSSASSTTTTDTAATEEPAEEVDYSAMSLDELKLAITTVSAGKLTVASSPDFAPYEFYAIDENGTPYLAGFEMDLAQYIADYLDLELEVIPMDFSGTLAELTNKSVDMGLSGYAPKPARAEVMDFSNIIISAGQCFVCLQENADEFTSLDDTNKAELKIGAQVGSIQIDLANQYSPDADIVEMSKTTDIMADLLAGQLDGAYMETTMAECYAKNYPDICVVLEVPYDMEGIVAGISKGNAALLEGVNRAIAECQSSGVFDEYVEAAIMLASGDIIEGLID